MLLAISVKPVVVRRTQPWAMCKVNGPTCKFLECVGAWMEPAGRPEIQGHVEALTRQFEWLMRASFSPTAFLFSLTAIHCDGLPRWPDRMGVPIEDNGDSFVYYETNRSCIVDLTKSVHCSSKHSMRSL